MDNLLYQKELEDLHEAWVNWKMKKGSTAPAVGGGSLLVSNEVDSTENSYVENGYVENYFV
jgi:hypothetical protein